MGHSKNNNPKNKAIKGAKSNEPCVPYDTNCIQDDTTSRQFVAIENARNYFNEHIFLKVFGKSLGPVMLRPARHGSAYGYYRHFGWSDDGLNPVPEISLCPRGLHRTPMEVFSTLLHELCHQYQYEFGKPGRGRYHNQEFAAIMASVGLICSDTGDPGGRQTGDHMTHYIDPNGLYAEVFQSMPEECLLPFKLLFDNDTFLLGKPYKSVGLSKIELSKIKTKYTCLGCGAAVWGRPALDLSCNPCKQVMVVIDDFGK